jgi:hypothetical protein
MTIAALAFAELRLDYLNHRANERARCVVFAAVPPGIAHVPDLGFVEMGLASSTLFERLRAVAQDRPD